jgi:hypothetical protein
VELLAIYTRNIMTTEAMQTLKESDLPKIVQYVRDLANEYPDFVYQTPSGKVAMYSAAIGGNGCSNVEGGDPKYPHLKGCIIGQAFAKQGFDLSDSNLRMRSAYQLFALLDLAPLEAITSYEISGVRAWLNHVQGQQDTGKTWSDAVSNADKALQNTITKSIQTLLSKEKPDDN